MSRVPPVPLSALSALSAHGIDFALESAAPLRLAYRMIKTVWVLTGLLLASSLAEANRTGIFRFQRRSNVSEESVDKDRIEFDRAQGFEDRLRLEDYDQTFTSLGNRRSSLEGSQAAGFDQNPREMATFPKRQSRWTTDDTDKLGDERYEIQSWNHLRDGMLSHEFSRTELRTPEARRIQEIVDRVNTSDINRFVSKRNRVEEDGILVVGASGDSQPVSYLGESDTEAPTASSESGMVVPVRAEQADHDSDWSQQSSPWFRNGESRVTTERRDDGLTERVRTTVRVKDSEE